MKLLFSNNHLCNFGGSELVTIELAEHYAGLGHDVTLYSPAISPEILFSLRHRDKIKLTLDAPDNLTEYDIVWSHHGLLIDQINRKTKKHYQLIISNHMSSYLDLEKPKFAAGHVDRIYANSMETARTFPDELFTQTKLFQNPSPECTVLKGPSRRVPLGLSISNHRPADLLSFMLEHQHLVDFKVYGLGTDNFTRFSANVARETNADFIICNGKSVNYALRAEIPVYIYDHFGGCGWLTEENFDVAEYYNFSGRGFSNPPDLKTILDFDKQTPIEMTEIRKNKFFLERRLIELGLV